MDRSNPIDVSDPILRMKMQKSSSTSNFFGNIDEYQRSPRRMMIDSRNIPINYNVVQPRNESRNNSIGSNSVGGGGGGGGGLSRSPSLLAQFSNSWGSRSTSPTPSYFSNSLRRVSSNTSNNLLMPNQSIQNLVKSFINKVSRGTQTDFDDNFDQISIASFASGLSGLDSDHLSRSRLKLFLNEDSSLLGTSNETDHEFIEELQKLRDQIDDRFKLGFDSNQPSRKQSRASTPDDSLLHLNIDRKLEDFGAISAAHDQSTSTDDLFERIDVGIQNDLRFVRSDPDRSSSTSGFNFFPFFQNTSLQTKTIMMSSEACQTDDIDDSRQFKCEHCRMQLNAESNRLDDGMARIDLKVSKIPLTTMNRSNNCDDIGVGSDDYDDDDGEPFSFDQQLDSLASVMTSKSNAYSQTDKLNEY
ncbi:hypothetical protein NH340_JMT07079 [Sarcoptes scabiei]|nr:hypothetical protein NH340_JMT07079 [Sarcoptes scabiei]